jgi:signal transduction histidine kinase
MSNKNFISLLTLNYKDQKLESIYLENQHKKRRRMNIIMNTIILINSLVNTLVFFFVTFKVEYNSLVQSFLLFARISSSVLTGLFFVLLLLGIFIKNKKVQSWISITSFFFLILVFTLFKLILALVSAENIIYSLVYSVQHLYRLTWFYFGLISFFQNIFLTMALCAVNIVFLAGYIPLKAYYGYSIDNLILIIASVISYFYLLEKKKSFFFYHQMKRINFWYQDLLDNANNGFIKIVNNKIDILNKIMVRNIMSNKDIVGLSLGNDVRNGQSGNEVIKNNSDVILNKLFTNLTFKKHGFIFIDSDNKYSMLKKYLRDHTNKEEFCFVGTTNYSTVEEDRILHFEIFGRYYLDTDEKGQPIDNYELMLNDVTNAITTEEAKAEVKYKSVFLAKVAHEFKNPLLCIIEFINQLQESVRGYDLDGSILELLGHIKSMSDFLIILIKDMDYFSTKNLNMSHCNTIDLEKVNVDKLMQFCQNIAQTLLKKYHKEDHIKFSVEKVNSPKYILTDEVKLKQIILNLLSNSVKFTMNGKISLSVESYTDSVKFEIRDTGTGLSDGAKDTLFKPFFKTNIENNSIGSGLGLSIVKELLEALGSKIEYDSTLGQGSVFSFTLKLSNSTKEKLNASRSSSFHSGETLKKEFQPNTGCSLIKNFTRNIINEDRINEEAIALNIQEQPKNIKTILIVDDEIFTRKSTVRLIKDYINKNHLDIEIQEAADGIECLYLYYLSHKQGKDLNLIVSDQSMAFMNGTTCSEILSEISKSRGYKQIPFVILTAYDISSISIKNNIKEVVTKPITLSYIEKIFKFIE